MIAPSTRRGTLALIASALMLAACGQGSGASDKGITIGYQKGGVLYVAQARGDLAKRLKARGFGPVKWVQFASGPPLIEAMRAGAVDLGAVGDTPLAYAQASGSDIVAVAAHSYPSAITGGLIVPKGSSIRTTADLKGKRLAFTKGSASELSAVIARRSHGLTLKDAQPINLTPGDAMTAFANASIDAWLTWDPYRTLAIHQSGAREVPIERGTLRSTVFFIAPARVTRERTAVLTATLDELQTEAKWAQTHLPEVIAQSAAATRLPPAVVKQMIDRYQGRAFVVDPLTEADVENQQRVLDLLLEGGVLRSALDASKAAWFGWRPKS